MTKPRNRDMLSRIQRTNLVLAVAAVALAGIVWGARGAIAAAVGAVLSVLNFWAIRRLGARAVRKVADGGTPREAVNLVLALSAKVALMLAAVFVAVRVAHLEILPFTLGISVFVVSILLAGTSTGLRHAEGAF